MALLAYFIGGPFNGRLRRLAAAPEEYVPPSPTARRRGAAYRRATPPVTIDLADEDAIVYVYSDDA